MGLVAALVLGACSGTYEPPPAPPDPDPPPADPVEAALRARAQTDAPYMIRQGPSQHATLEPGRAWSFAVVLAPGLCYKVLAQGSPEVDLQLRLFDDRGVLVQEAGDASPAATLGSARPLCPQDPISYRVEATSPTSGAVFAQVYASP